MSYYDYGTLHSASGSTESVITWVITAIFGILSIILFFKIWGMANNMKRLAKKYVPNNNDGFIREILKGNPNVSDMLFDALFDELNVAYTHLENTDMILTKYKKLYAKANLPFPAIFEHLSNGSDWRKLISTEDKQINNTPLDTWSKSPLRRQL